MFGFELTVNLAAKPELSSDVRTHSAISLKGFRMLYVEDMEPNRFVMKAMVKPWEVALDMASSGHEALNLVREYDYDLVLMDIQMPEMDGVETLLQIKQEHGAMAGPGCGIHCACPGPGCVEVRESRVCRGVDQACGS